MSIKRRTIRRKRPEKSLTTEQKIFSAARTEFSEKGLDGARMQSIADHAGTNKALLHYYFRSKERLFEVTLKDIISNLWADIYRQLNTHQNETDLRALISAIVSAYITTFAAQPTLPKAIIRELAAGSPILFNVIDAFIASHHDAQATIFSIYNKELSRGTIKHIETPHFMMNLMGMCAVTFIAKPIIEHISKRIGPAVAFDQKFYAKRIKAITEMACDGIFNKK